MIKHTDLFIQAFTQYMTRPTLRVGDLRTPGKEGPLNEEACEPHELRDCGSMVKNDKT